MNEINLKDITNVLLSVEHYNGLGGYLNQLDPKQRETLNEYHHLMLNYSRDKKYIDDEYLRHWKEVNLYVINQMWGNTSGGWEGIGGSAMTSSYTTIIENKHGEAIFVYYNGKLAYIAKSNNKLKKYSENNFSYLPGIQTCGDVLDIIYKKN
jgi:hypothetical protein